MPKPNNLSIAIIGAGPLGIATGRELLQQGINNFTIFESAPKAGGTWHLHSYPGLACDVWAHSYTFSYAPNPQWSANFVLQPEIESYLQRCAREFGLEPHMRFNTTITRATYQQPGNWLLVTDSGEEQVFNIVINAMGNQHTAIYPDIEGLADFRGESWHSTFWNHDVALEGKRIAVVGSAAAAVQIVPELAKVARQLYVLQRTPNWILPRNKKDYSPLTLSLFKRFPALAGVLRKFQGKLMGMMHQGALLGNKRMEFFENMGRKTIRKLVNDKSLHEALTPKSRFGCKRPLVSDDFYPSFNRDNVSLVPAAAKKINTRGIETADGQQLDVDIIIYCTGYRVMDFDRIDILGQHGQKLGDVMEQAPEAYKGIAVPGFPNYFFGAGPNGIVLSVTYFSSIETNVECIVRLISEMQDRAASEIAVKPELHKTYNDWLKSRFSDFSWGHSSCNSYYQTATGATPFLYPGDFKMFCEQQANCSIEEFDVVV